MADDPAGKRRLMTMIDETTGDHAMEIVRGDVPGGPSTSQTIMVTSLQRLLSVVPTTAAPEDYRSAVMDENILAKETAGAREWTFRQLRRFYGLDPRLLLFRALRDIWTADATGQPLLAMICALARDPVLRASCEVILQAEVGAEVGAPDFTVSIEEHFPGAYKQSTMRTASHNLASSWRQSGHLQVGKAHQRNRSRAEATPATVAYALLLGHLQGKRGQPLFETLWARVLDQPMSLLVNLATSASQQGLLEFRHAGGVVDVTFHELLRPFEGLQGKLS